MLYLFDCNQVIDYENTLVKLGLEAGFDQRLFQVGQFGFVK